MKLIILSCLLFVLLLPFDSKAQTTLEKRYFLNNKIELLVPKDFKPMSAKIIEQKYYTHPNVVLTDNKAEIHILISYLDLPIHPNQIIEFNNSQIKFLKTAHPYAKFFDSGVKTINGKKVGYIKFIDQTIFNYNFLTDMDGKVLLLTFYCTEKLLPKWRETAETIVSSIKVK